MTTRTRTSKRKIAAVVTALSATMAFSGALAYLTDHDAARNEFSFLQADSTGGLITLTEPTWEKKDGKAADLTWKQYASQGILPGETLQKDPTITVNEWLKTGNATNTNNPELNLFMKVMVPMADVNGDGKADELFAYTANAAWTPLDKVETLTLTSDADADHPAGTYRVYRYYYGNADDGIARVTSSDKIAELFTKVTYTKAATKHPTANQHIIVDAYAIQADNLSKSDAASTDNLSANDAASIYQLASGETIA